MRVIGGAELMELSLDAYLNWEDGEPEPEVEYEGQSITITKATGLLWRFTDFLPNSAKGEIIELVPWHGKKYTFNTLVTYAQAARILRAAIDYENYTRSQKAAA